MENNTRNAQYNISFTEAVKRFWAKGLTFSGRATRSEYWFSQLFLFLLNFAVSILFPAAIPICDLICFIPFLAITCRRLHDTGKSGVVLLMAWCLIIVGSAFSSALPPFGLIIMLIGLFIKVFIFICMFFDSERGKNQFGDSEKYPSTGIIDIR